MSSQTVKTLGLFKRYTLFDKGLGTRLPEAYKKFYKEWKETKPTAVHYIPEDGKWKRNEFTGKVTTVQNVPIPLKFPKEHDEQIWGGEGVVQGFEKRSHLRRRVPHFWTPIIHRSVVYSEVLNKHISVLITDRAIQLIHSNYGFDHYVLKTLACDLRSLLPLALKRKILQQLMDGCPAYANNPEKQIEVYNRYQEYLAAYTPEEIEWYGYSYEEACNKIQKIIEGANKPVPLKTLYRAQLIESLKNDSNLSKEITESKSWINKINPFNKTYET